VVFPVRAYSKPWRAWSLRVDRDRDSGVWLLSALRGSSRVLVGGAGARWRADFSKWCLEGLDVDRWDWFLVFVLPAILGG
jgi:hypothetical protein